MKGLWSKFTRRTVIVFAGIACLTLLTGCPDDDDDVPQVVNPGLYSWTFTYAVSSPPGGAVDSLTLILPWDNTDDITSTSITEGNYTLDVVRNASNVTLTLTDSSDGSTLTTSGAGINPPDNVTGNFTLVDKSVTPNVTYMGTFSLDKD